MLSANFFLKLFINLRCEILAIFRCYQELLYPLLFLMLTIILFPLSISADPVLLKKIAAGVYWVIVLFLILLMLDQLFRDDWQEGDLEQLILLPNELTFVLFIKLLVFCLVINVSLFLMTPILSLSLFVPVRALKVLYLSILLGTPTLVFLGGIVRALTLSLRHSGLLIILIVLPFYIPILILASSAVSLASMGFPANGPLAWLSVLMILSVSLSPLVISKILRLGIAFT